MGLFTGHTTSPLVVKNIIKCIKYPKLLRFWSLRYLNGWLDLHNKIASFTSSTTIPLLIKIELQRIKSSIFLILSLLNSRFDLKKVYNDLLYPQYQNLKPKRSIRCQKNWSDLFNKIESYTSLPLPVLNKWSIQSLEWGQKFRPWSEFRPFFNICTILVPFKCVWSDFLCPYIGIKEKEGKRKEETGTFLSSSAF